MFLSEWREFPSAPPTWPDLGTLEGSNCTDIMTCAGGCGYSF